MPAKSNSEDVWVDWIRMWAGNSLRSWRNKEAGYMQYRRRLVDAALIPQTQIAEAMLWLALAPTTSLADARKLLTAANLLGSGGRFHLSNVTIEESYAEMAKNGDADAKAAISRIASELLPQMPKSLARHT